MHSDNGDKEVKPRVSIRSSGGRDGEVGFVGFTPEEIEKMQGTAHGYSWMRIKDGIPEFSPSYKPLPAPTDDLDMMPFWSPAGRDVSVQLELVSFGEFEGHSPSIIIQYLCGYYFTPENYRTNAGLLESYGFECLRSRRGVDGKYSELWRLPGFWAARGGLKEILPTDHYREPKKVLDQAISFLCRTVSFGSLDVVVQRAAMMPD